MNLAPLTGASPVVQAHACAALVALGLGGAQLALPKGALPHRSMGYCWAALMLTVALTSFFIHSFRPLLGPFGAIHLLSLFVCFRVPAAVLAARRGKLMVHRLSMIWIYALALIATGLFTLWPGRIMNKVVFG